MVYQHLQTRATKTLSRPYQESRFQRLRGRFPRRRREEKSARAGSPADSAKIPKVFWKEKVNTPIPGFNIPSHFPLYIFLGLTSSTTFPHFCAWEKASCFITFFMIGFFTGFRGRQKDSMYFIKSVAYNNALTKESGRESTYTGGRMLLFFPSFFACWSFL